jgi:hypothetical protein
MSNDKQYTPVQWLQVELSKRVPAEFWAENMELFIQAQSMERRPDRKNLEELKRKLYPYIHPRTGEPEK